MKLKLDIDPDIVAMMQAEVAAGERAVTAALQTLKIGSIGIVVSSARSEERGRSPVSRFVRQSAWYLRETGRSRSFCVAVTRGAGGWRRASLRRPSGLQWRGTGEGRPSGS